MRPPIPVLSGTHIDPKWRIAYDQGKQAIFPIMLTSDNKYDLVGTGFFIFSNGVFVTAKHVAMECIEANPDKSTCIFQFFPDNIFVLRPVTKFYVHETADLAIGMPVEVTDNKTGKPAVAPVVRATTENPAVGSRAATWAYPRHRISYEGNSAIVELEPQFYDGFVEEHYLSKGPSSKLITPYIQTNIHLHGGASGGPVLDEGGNAFALASASYDGLEDLAFITPLSLLLDIKIECGDKFICLKELPYIQTAFANTI